MTPSFRLGDSAIKSLMAISGKTRPAGSTECFRYKWATRDQTGHVKLANGEVWRFAFRSHDDGEDSYSVFTGPEGSYRVRGDYFCCEVEIAMMIAIVKLA
jgi:hypothetical protein